MKNLVWVIGLSRIYGGIHFLSADLDGLNAGHHVGEYVFQNFLRPSAAPALLAVAQSSSNGRPQISVSATVGRTYVVEVSTNLIHWASVLTNTAPFKFEEAGSTSVPVRFYRATASE